jgi:hypothetical protein
MPKDATKNVDRYKIRGGQLNEFELAENRKALAGKKPEGGAKLIPGTPPEDKDEGLRPTVKTTSKATNTTSKTSKATSKANKATSKASKASGKATKGTKKANKATKKASKSSTKGVSAKTLAARKAAKKK